ncbi:MAG: DL-endopeptidase inhibitor IseA family protein [Oscillospiraceae bacterium]|nr:DL-endopeptidase inhibitor IseA family protein [Oscillospiraceae bacterium]
MKKITLICVLALAIFCFAACTGASQQPAQEPETSGEAAESAESAEPAIPQPTDEEVEQAYQEATEASWWFRMLALETDPATATEYEGNEGYCKVLRFSTLAELRAYLETLFSDEVIDAFLAESGYVEINGELYTREGARGSDIFKGEETLAVERESDSRIILKVRVEILDPDADFAVTGYEEFDFPYEYTGNKWVFTDFPVVR